MELHPGSLLGLPAGRLDPVDAVALRWGLLALSVLWAAVSLRARPRAAFLCGLAFGTAAVGFWVLALGRPYGLLVDPIVTRAAADAAVVAATGDAGRGAIAESSPGTGLQVRLAGWGPDPVALLLLPTLLPLLAFVGVALAIALLAPGPRALLGASLWLAFPAGALEGVWGDGFLSAPWRRSEAQLGVAAIVAALLLLSRVRRGAALARALAILLALAWAAVLPDPGSGSRGALGAMLALTLDQGVFFLLGLAGLIRGAGAAAWSLLVAGSVLAAAALLPGSGLDPWCGQTLYRVGLLLAACGPIEAVERRIGGELQGLTAFARFGAAQRGRALLLALAVPSSTLAWWDPIELDGRVARRSLEPLPPALLEATGWVRRHTDPGEVFVASPEHAPAVAALAGRQVLRAPTLGRPPDDLRRRVQRAALEGRPDPDLERLRVAYVFVGPDDPASWGLASPDELERRGLRALFRGRDGRFAVHRVAGF
jgi:hypothetical protein